MKAAEFPPIFALPVYFFDVLTKIDQVKSLKGLLLPNNYHHFYFFAFASLLLLAFIHFKIL